MVVRIERWEQFRNKRVRKRVRVRENTGVGFTVFLLFVDWYWRVSRRGGYEVDFERRVGERIRTFFLDWFLVLGLHLGVEGAGWSTFASTVLEFSLFSRAMFDRGILNVPPTSGEEDFFYKQTIKDFLENDVKDMSGKLVQLVSNGSNQLLRTLFLQFVLVRATALATENNVSGPHQIVSQVWWIELFVLDAIAVAAQTLVSTRLAKNDGSEEDILAARKAVDRCLFWSFLLGVLLTVVTELFSNDLPKIFTGDAAVAAATFVPLAFILAPLQPLNALVFVGDGVFQGANDFKFLSKAMIVCSLFALGGVSNANIRGRVRQRFIGGFRAQ